MLCDDGRWGADGHTGGGVSLYTGVSLRTGACPIAGALYAPSVTTAATVSPEACQKVWHILVELLAAQAEHHGAQGLCKTEEDKNRHCYGERLLMPGDDDKRGKNVQAHLQAVDENSAPAFTVGSREMTSTSAFQVNQHIAYDNKQHQQ